MVTPQPIEKWGERRPDEVALWNRVVNGESPRAAGAVLGIPRNRVAYLCRKWERQDIYDWGFALDMGWAELGDVTW